jgi:hypothetical protein
MKNISHQRMIFQQPVGLDGTPASTPPSIDMGVSMASKSYF